MSCFWVLCCADAELKKTGTTRKKLSIKNIVAFMWVSCLKNFAKFFKHETHMKATIFLMLNFFLVVPVFFNSASAQQRTQKHDILRQDSLFWIAYNSCDVKAMQQFFTSDLEFYHDK